MLAKIEQALRETPVGAVEIIIDGQKIKYSRLEAIREYKYWKRIAARNNGRRPVSGSIDLGRAWS